MSDQIYYCVCSFRRVSIHPLKDTNKIDRTVLYVRLKVILLSMDLSRVVLQSSDVSTDKIELLS